MRVFSGTLMSASGFGMPVMSGRRLPFKDRSPAGPQKSNAITSPKSATISLLALATPVKTAGKDKGQFLAF